MSNRYALERYEIGEVIGRGAVGVVHRGRQLRPNRAVAIKILKEELAQDDAVRQRFLHEADLCARLNHSGIVQVYDVLDDVDGLAVEDEGRPAIVMELLEGETLRERLKRAALTTEDAVYISRAVLSSLEHAHTHGKEAIVHRDIKPANIILCPPNAGESVGAVKVMDFGIARVSSLAGMTKTGAQMGTPEYMSPEQVQGQHVDARSDLYAVGALLYEMLTGRPPFQAESPIAVIYAQVNKKPDALPDSIPLHLRRAVMKSLAKDPAARFQSAREFSVSLQEPETSRRAAPKLNIKAVAAAFIVFGLLGALWSFASPRTERQSRVQAIGFQQQRIESGKLPQGENKVVRRGQTGREVVEEDVVWRWGSEQTRRIAARKITRAPIDQIIHVGTMHTTFVTQTRAVPFKSLSQIRSDKLTGYRKIVRNGKNGKEQIVWRVVWNGNVETSRQREATRNRVLEAPIDQLTEVGTLKRTRRRLTNPPRNDDTPSSSAPSSGSRYIHPSSKSSKRDTRRNNNPHPSRSFQQDVDPEPASHVETTPAG